MAQTKPERDSLAALRNNAGDADAGDTASRQRRWDVFVPLNHELTRRQAAFDDALHEMLDKGSVEEVPEVAGPAAEGCVEGARALAASGSDSVPPA